MSKKTRNQLINVVIALVVVMVLGIVFVPMITVSADAIANETVWFKFVDWFTQLNTTFVDNAAFYLLVVAVFTFLLFARRYLRNRH